MSKKQSAYNKNMSLESKDVKKKILRYLHQSNINLKAKPVNIVNDQDLDDIKYGDYIICPRFVGTRSWVIFFNSGNDYYAVSFPKYNKRNVLPIHPINLNVSKEFYRGTIMEGIFYRINDKRYLVIDEIYQLGGHSQLLKSKDDRLKYFAQYIKDTISVNPNYVMYVSKYFCINQQSLIDLYEKIKSDNKIQEIIFYPKIYGGKIYLYKIINTDLIDNIIKLSNFFLQKTPNPDVYNLLNVVSKNKIDLALIPDMETSKKCKQWFKNKHKETLLLVKCQMDMEKKKWIPLELVEEDIQNDELDDDSDTNVIDV